jgi:hypothetical protein
MASIPFRAISSFACSIRARRSSFEIGATFPANEGNAAIGAGRELVSPAPVSPRKEPAAPTAVTAPAMRKNDRLETMLSPQTTETYCNFRVRRDYSISLFGAAKAPKLSTHELSANRFIADRLRADRLSAARFFIALALR